jgi:two-component system NtrC family sensor kinase
MSLKSWLSRLSLLKIGDEGDSPQRYNVLRRNMMILMIFVTVVPLVLMAAVNYHQYQTALREEIVNPLRILVNKAKHSFELFIAERLSAVSFIASAYTFDQLADENELKRIFRVMKSEFGGFVDLGLIDESGIQVSYVGPYELKGKNYSEQEWLQETRIRGSHVSDVFLGYRRFPHIVIAVQSDPVEGRSWTLRATIDTQRFNDLIASMGIDPKNDAFLMNKRGVLQTQSRWYGDVLEHVALPIPPASFEANVVELTDRESREIIMAYASFPHFPYTLVVVKQRAEVLRAWYTLKSELFFLFLASVIAIFLVVFKLTDVLIRRMRECDQRREAAFREMEHSHKLSSIGRLAAGVAHEINNPMAIINEKAGLMEDLIRHGTPFPEKEKFLKLIQAILQSVQRCRSITHRLLGFAKRMEVQVEVLDLNEVLTETSSFLDREAVYRNVAIEMRLQPDLPKIASDRGQLQQVLLNILNNALAAVDHGGTISITSWEKDADFIGVAVEDNGCGMSEETIKHIFEPFFTTKKGTGTGLGLPITYGIVKKLGGSIEVESKEGVGTRMTVILPKRATEEAGG